MTATNQVTFRLPHDRHGALKIALIKEGVAMQHFFDACSDLLVDFVAGKCGDRTETEVRRVIERAKNLKTAE